MDLFYVDAVEGGTLGPAAFAERKPCKTLEALVAALTAVDLRLIAAVETLAEADLARKVRVHRGAWAQTDRMDDIPGRLLLHQTHHRGQAHAMLSSLSVAPLQLDEFIVGDDAAARREDLSRLGLTEAWLMADCAGLARPCPIADLCRRPRFPV